MSTKEKILEESLRLFSISGFEAVSIRAIAEAVGVSSGALYKHFSSKSDIFDAIVDKCKQDYLDAIAKNTKDITSKAAVIEVCLGSFNYQTTNTQIVQFRRMLMLEQFRNPKVAALYKEFFVDIPIHSQMDIFSKLMKNGFMKKADPKVCAMELYAPFYLYHFVQEDVASLQPLFQKHIDEFVAHYGLGANFK